MGFWIGTGFNALKSVGWQWRNIRRTDPARVERHRLVLSAATLLTLAFGGRRRTPSAEMESERVAGVAESGAGAQPTRERISPRHDDAEPPFGKGQDAARRAAAARTLDASAGWREGRLPPRNPKPAPSPSREKGFVARDSRLASAGCARPPPSPLSWFSGSRKTGSSSCARRRREGAGRRAPRRR